MARPKTNPRPYVQHTWSPWEDRRGVRTPAGELTWLMPLAWEQEAQQQGRRARILVAPDLFRVDDTTPAGSWELSDRLRRRLFWLIGQTPHLDWLMLTQTPRDAAELLPRRWNLTPPPNVWLGVRLATQDDADRLIPPLLALPAGRHLALVTPTEGIRLQGRGNYGERNARVERAYLRTPDGMSGLDWLIVEGGDTPLHPDWVRSLRDQATRADVSFYFAGWGMWAPGVAPRVDALEQVVINNQGVVDRAPTWARMAGVTAPEWVAARIGRARSGRMLDQVRWEQVPE